MCKISVIIPVYNSARFLKNTLKSVKEQTINDIEIICIDDGSTDESASIIKKEQDFDSRIKYIHQENLGAGTARNQGISIAKGKYLAFIDSDDEYPSKNVLELLYDAAVKNEANICGGSVVQKTETGISYNEKRIFSKEGFIKFKDYQFDFLYVRFIYKRTFIIKNNIKFSNLRIYEDPLFLVQAMIFAENFYAIKENVYLYSGPHQINNMDTTKIHDYLIGITKELELSSKYSLAKLHNIVWQRLENDASYYAENILYEGDKKTLQLVLLANAAINRKLLNISDEYILPILVSLLTTSVKYMKIRNIRIVRCFLHLLRIYNDHKHSDKEQD